MFITNNHASFHLWCMENLIKHQEVLKYYDHNCSSNLYADSACISYKYKYFENTEAVLNKEFLSICCGFAEMHSLF